MATKKNHNINVQKTLFENKLFLMLHSSKKIRSAIGRNKICQHFKHFTRQTFFSKQQADLIIRAACFWGNCASFVCLSYRRVWGVGRSDNA